MVVLIHHQIEPVLVVVGVLTLTLTLTLIPPPPPPPYPRLLLLSLLSFSLQHPFALDVQPIQLTAVVASISRDTKRATMARKQPVSKKHDLRVVFIHDLNLHHMATSIGFKKEVQACSLRINAHRYIQRKEKLIFGRNLEEMAFYKL